MLQIPNHQLEGHSPYFEDFARATNSIVHLRTQAPTKSLTTTNKNIQVTLQYVTYHFFVALRPNAGHGLLILEVSRSHTTTHHSR